MKSSLWFLMQAVMFATAVPAFADEGDVILNPGTVSGSVSIAGHRITSITVYAIDTVKVYSATTTVNVPAGADSRGQGSCRDLLHWMLCRTRFRADDRFQAVREVVGSRPGRPISPAGMMS